MIYGENVNPSVEMDVLQALNARHITRREDWDLGVRLSLLAVVPSAVAGLGVVALNRSPIKRVAGALAPMAAFGLGMFAESRYSAAKERVTFTANAAMQLAETHSLPVPSWATLDTQEF